MNKGKILGNRSVTVRVTACGKKGASLAMWSGNPSSRKRRYEWLIRAKHFPNIQAAYVGAVEALQRMHALSRWL